MTVMTKPDTTPPDETPDPVVDEVRERGYALTRRFNNDPKQFFECLRQLAEKHPEKNYESSSGRGLTLLTHQRNEV